MNETITAYYNGILVMVLPEFSFLNEKNNLIAAIKKIDDKVPNSIPVPKEVPLDNLSFENGQKCGAVKMLKNMLIKEKKETKRKKKTIKKSPISY